jgi:DNA repair photolyase
MNLFGMDISDGLELAAKVDVKYQPVFDASVEKDRAALAWYFLPHHSAKVIVGVSRPRVLKWYCPFADQRDFPTGHRYCINVYTGCSHNCEYCYAASYEPDEASCKKNFEQGLLRDLADLEEFDVPPAPVHLSNSTDPFQPLEAAVGQTKFALEQILKSRRRFTSVVLLTKNPTIAVRDDYLPLLKALNDLPADHPKCEEFADRNLPGLRLEISLAFWRDEARAVFDPGAPSVAERSEAIRTLRQAGIPVVLRIDPLLPRNPLPNGVQFADFDLAQPQTLADLESLVAFASEVGVMHIVYSATKIVQPRFKPMPDLMQRLKHLYERISVPEKLVFRGGSWRLPDIILRQQIVEPFLDVCNRYNIPAYFCKQNLIITP